MTLAVAEKIANPGVSFVSRSLSDRAIFTVNAGKVLVLGTVGLNVAGESLGFGAAEVSLPSQLEIGDYVILVDGARLVADIWRSDEVRPILGGFHYAPGGNASARTGGDDVPAINPLSMWDLGFRPSCADPRGMVRVSGVRGSEHVPQHWQDIYMLGVDHLQNGTSAFGVEIADGHKAKPKTSSGDREAKLDYLTAKRIYEAHGKGLMSFAEFSAGTYGVTEKSAADDEPELTGLDALRTSSVGVMQATGNMWCWGHDGDPDNPRASLFGGSWIDGDDAGSRHARVAYDWPGYSYEDIGARGRSDHLQA